MTWRKNTVMGQRIKFINDYLEKRFNLSDLCRQYDISRPTAYFWIDRFHKEGYEGLSDRDRVPLNNPRQTSPDIVTEILKVKQHFSKWGPKKILAYLKNTQEQVLWPCETTIENILKKNGLVERRKLRKRFAQSKTSLIDCNASNDTWCIDFKGWWLTKDNQKFEPFTLTDAFSRYLLCCENLQFNDALHVWAVFERLFREYGLPLKVRSDNGSPFATVGAGRLSKLSINLIKAGVIPEWIQPGEPQQNGRHERMHLTLKKEGVDLSLNYKSQAVKLEQFQEYYNFTRPHEALGQKVPGSIYQPSSRIWDGKLREPEYPNDFQKGLVRSCGKMVFKNRDIYIGRTFGKELIGLKKNDNNIEAYYGPIYLGVIKDNKLEFERIPGRRRN